MTSEDVIRAETGYHLRTACRGCRVRLINLLALAGACWLAWPQLAFCDDPSEISPETIMALLSHESVDDVNELLQQRLYKWSSGSVGYSIFAETDTTALRDSLDHFAAILSVNQVPLFIYDHGMKNTSAETLIVFDHRMSDAITKYHLGITDIALRPSEDNLKAVEHAIQSDDEKCWPVISFKNADLEINRAFLFVSTDQNEQAIHHCVSSLMLIGVGLTTLYVHGSTALTPDASVEMPTANDIAAVKLLYTPALKPGDTINRLLHVQDNLVLKKPTN